MTSITGMNTLTGMSGVSSVTQVTRMNEMTRCPSYIHVEVSVKRFDCTPSHVMIQRVKCSVFNVVHVYILSKDEA